MHTSVIISCYHLIFILIAIRAYPKLNYYNVLLYLKGHTNLSTQRQALKENHKILNEV